jgi:TonB dependent receptor/TonB-dependent Receptor Plug Domain
MSAACMSRKWMARVVLAVLVGLPTTRALAADGKERAQPLAEALDELRARGLKLIYSTRTVRPTMLVVAPPTASSPRQVLDELLAPHGLEAREGPGGSLLIVKGAKRDVERPSAGAVPKSSQAGIGFADSVVVKAATRVGDPGPAALAVRPGDVMAIAGALDNVARAVQTLPGVVGTDEFDSRIAVRGGGPDENLTLMDGVEIHNPFRMIGMVSAFNPEIVESFDLEKSGFDVRYGDRLSSVLVVRNRLGNAQRTLGGSAAVSLTDANLTLEGALPGARTGSWLVTGRRSYFDVVAGHFIDFDLPAFGDLQSRLAWDRSATSRLTFSGLVSSEHSEHHERDDHQNWQFQTVGRNAAASVSYNATWGSRIMSRTIASYYRFRDGIDFGGRLDTNGRRGNEQRSADSQIVDISMVRGVTTRDLALREELAVELSERHRLDAGIEYHHLDNHWSWEISGSRSDALANAGRLPVDSGMPSASLPAHLDSRQPSERVGVWVQDRWNVSPAIFVQPGVRLEQSNVNGRTTFSPRLATAWELGAQTRLKLSAAQQYQSPGYEKLYQADQFIDLSSARSLHLQSERALQGALAFERDVSRDVTARVEIYGRKFSNLLLGRLETDDERRARIARYDFPAALRGDIPSAPLPTSDPSDTGRGRAYGVEAHVAKRATSRADAFSGWLSYAYGVAAREAYGRVYPYTYDRRHAGTVVAQLRLSKQVSLGMTGRLASGFPRTPVLGARVAADADAVDSDGDGNRNELVPARASTGALVFVQDFGDVDNLNRARLPVFARVDARLTVESRGAAPRWTIYLDVINLLNRKNAGFIKSYFVADPSSDRPRLIEERSFWIPFLPTVGVRFRF